MDPHQSLCLHPVDEWCSVVRVLWLILLCVVLLVIFTTIIGRICVCSKSSPPSRCLSVHLSGIVTVHTSMFPMLSEKPTICPVGENITGPHLNGKNIVAPYSYGVRVCVCVFLYMLLIEYQKKCSTSK